MNPISRGVRNAFRNTIRTISITFILALSIAMSLIMFLSFKTVQSKINSVKSSIGNTITVSPAGVRGFEGGGELLTSTDADTIAGLPNVTRLAKVISDRMTTGQDTNLASAIDAGSFGQRQQRRAVGNSARPNQDFSTPIMVTGTNDLSVTASLSLSQLNIVSGAVFDPNISDNYALLGVTLAAKNNLTTGSTFTAYGQTVKVAGIFDGGNQFANATAVFPLKALQQLSGQADQINSIIVEANSIDSVSSLQAAIKGKLGDKVDVTSQQDRSSEAVKPLENIKTISLYSLIGSVAAGTIIIFMTMMMVVRERRREIGVLKAIGSSNLKIVEQFSIEALTLTLSSSVLGIVLGIIFSNPVLKVLVNNSESVVANQGQDFIRGQGAARVMMRLGGGALNGAQNALRDIHAVVGLNVIFYGLLAAVVIAIIGSAIPAFLIAKIRPAEVMRAE